MLDVLPTAQEQRYEDGFPAQSGEGVGQGRPVDFDVPEPHVESRPQLAHPLKERGDRPQRAGVATPVRDGDEGGAGGGRHGGAGSVQSYAAELTAQLDRDAGDELRGAVERKGVLRRGRRG
ncbi:hypothetical protein GCM10010331_08420 [Streptomyces xanthochromogenes]|nr:hypothetical protein GCM10010331_08420 [Streptomyces xanthochromogenes]